MVGLEVDDAHGPVAFGVGPEYLGLADGATDDGFAVAFEPVGGADAGDGPVGGIGLQFGGGGVPVDGVIEITAQESFDGVVGEELGAGVDVMRMNG